MNNLTILDENQSKPIKSASTRKQPKSRYLKEKVPKSNLDLQSEKRTRNIRQKKIYQTVFEPANDYS